MFFIILDSYNQISISLTDLKTRIVVLKRENFYYKSSQKRK